MQTKALDALGRKLAWPDVTTPYGNALEGIEP
jgi:hypothetical protein